jgi:dienelactone hydrolase
MSENYTENEVTFLNHSDNINLSGTLTLPKSKDKFPTVILIHGQGPMDRDQTFFNISPFKEISEYFANNGIAVLRYDKRGIGKSEGEFGSSNVDNFSSDVLSAFAYLNEYENIDPNKIGILGISEGGFIANKLASSNNQFAFCVSLAGPVLPVRENMALSFALLTNNTLDRNNNFSSYKKQFSKLFDLITQSEQDTTVKAEALDIVTQLLPELINDNTNVIMSGIDQLTPEQFVGVLSSPCFTDNLNNAPSNYLVNISCPYLALFGQIDVQVPAIDNMKELQRILSSNKSLEYNIEEIPNTNHLFQKCNTGFPAEYLSIDHSISPDVLELIVEWIKNKVI